mgnify:CR=1 FL=1
MGRGIAQVAAQTGYEVILFDAFKNSLDFGYAFIKTQLDKGSEKGKWTADDAAKAFGRIKVTAEMTDLKNCDLVIEAATEKKELKFDIFKKLDEIVKAEELENETELNRLRENLDQQLLQLKSFISKLANKLQRKLFGECCAL